MKYSVVIPTYNHCYDLLKPCLDSLVQYTDLEITEVLVVANGCVDETKQVVEQYNNPSIKLLWFDKALGFSGAVNKGVQAAQGEYIVILNNDTILHQQPKNDWLERLSKPFIKNKNIAVTGPLKANATQSPIKKDFIVFFCAMIKREIFDELGLLDESFGAGGAEDIDFCVRAELAGYETVQTSNWSLGAGHIDFPITHRVNGTVSGISNWEEIFFGNLLKIQDKYKDIILKKVSKIGVITPVYNYPSVTEAINSVLKTRHINYIHYVYNDASTDQTAEILNQIIDPRVAVIHGEAPNKGQSYGRNVLIKRALEDGCDYIAFLDADDVWYDNHLMTCFAYADDDTDIIYSKPEYKLEDGSTVYPFGIPIPRTFIGKQFNHNNFIWTSGVIVKSKCFIDNNFDSTLDSIEDWDMWLRLYEQGYKFQPCPETTFKYLVREHGSAQHGVNKKTLFEQKHKLTTELKLHLACGYEYFDDYINIDLYAPDDAKVDLRCDIRKLPYDDNTIDEIKAIHVIEHFHFKEFKDVLDEWYRVLKPGGKLILETPDLLSTCDAFVKGNEEFRISLYGHIFSMPWIPGQTHKFLFTENQLRGQLEWSKFQNVTRIPPISKYPRPETQNLFLTVEAFK